MSVPRAPQPAKLVIGIFLGDKPLVLPVARDLVHAFGTVDMASPWSAFDFTSYYEAEMGRPLYRRILTFQRLVEQDTLAGIKRTTNAVEDQYSENGKRRVNIDPGYMVPPRFVLASGKDYAHRICIGKGIYGDLTLMYQKGRFQALPWTYPDYATDEMRDYLRRVRGKYILDLRQQRLKEGASLQHGDRPLGIPPGDG